MDLVGEKQGSVGNPGALQCTLPATGLQSFQIMSKYPPFIKTAAILGPNEPLKRT